MTALNLFDSDVAGLHMKLKTFNYDAKYYLPKMGKLESIVGIQGMHQTNNTNLGEEYLIPDATTNDFGVFGIIMSGIITAYFRPVCV
jgi:iron complex outermembrane receptor protein